MKKQVVAVMLSLAMCASTGAEASIVSAAEFSSEVSAAEETESDEASVADENDGSAVVDDSAVDIDSDAAADDADQAEDSVPADTENQADVDFSSGEEEVVTEEAEDEAPAVTEETAEEAGKANESSDANGKVASLEYTRWKFVNGKWKLEKYSPSRIQETAAAVGTEETAEAAGTDENAAVDTAAETTEAVADESQAAVDTTAETTEAVVDESQAAVETAVETQQTDETQPAADEQQAEEAGASAYYTSADGLVKITTLNVNNSVLASGYYAFDKDGYLLTGRNAVGNDFYYFRTEGDVQIVNALSADKKTPYNSQLGQAISDTWIWDAGQGAFNYYGHDNGKQVNLEANKIYSINGASYYLLNGGKPYVGDQKISGGICYFQPAASAGDIPGKMAVNGWFGKSTNKGTQWRYFNANGDYQKKESEHTSF